MKNALIIIRVCKRDEIIALRCYYSFIKYIPNIEIIIFAEEDEYNTFGDSEFNMWYHTSYDNYGGRDNIIPYIEYLKKFNFIINFDYTIVVDSDIELLKNPLDEEFEFGGIQDKDNVRHFSGQLLIFRSNLLKKVLEYENIYELTEELISKKISIADDTVLSYIATEYTNKTRNFFEKEYWIHSKEL